MQDQPTDTDGSQHKYHYSFDPDGMIAPARVARMAGRNQKILELGSGPGSITRVLTGLNNNEVTALELDGNAVELVRPYCKRVFQVNLNDVSWSECVKTERFDAVLAADVLEHIYEPTEVLKEMVTLLKEDGAIVISLPHIGHASIGCCLLLNNFRYSDRGLLDRTHIRFFSMTNIQSLFESAGLKIIQAEFVTATPEATEFADLWAQLHDKAKMALNSNPFSLVYQVVIKAVPVASPGPAISLLELPVEGWSDPYKQAERSEPAKQGQAGATALAASRIPDVLGVQRLFQFLGKAFRYIGRRLP